MFNFFYAKLAFSNIRRDKRTYLPHIIATAVISGVYLLIAGLMFSDGLGGLPNGKTAQSMFIYGMVVFSIFAFFFMVYINNFLIGRRKREFGLYAVLGLEKRHVGRVLFWEDLFTLGTGLLLGMICALIFGRLAFWILLKLIGCMPESRFVIGRLAYLITLLFFGAIFVFTSLYNALRVCIANPMELIKAPKKGEKDSALIWPLAVIGAIMLIAAYYFAWTVDHSGSALGIFFPLVILVIIATYILMRSGSVAFLKLLKSSRRIYYRPSGFIAISGMIQRMKQNARSLATICILSTMLIVTVSGTMSLYIGREQMLRQYQPHDILIRYRFMDKDEGYTLPTAEEMDEISENTMSMLIAAAHDNGVAISRSDFTVRTSDNAREFFIDMPNTDQTTGLAIINSFEPSFYHYNEQEKHGELGIVPRISEIYSQRAYNYAMYGGLLFMGIFFGMLFLAVTVLIIYFKQISEGYDDKAQFDILQKVGMDDKQVKSTINSQVLWVFFIPLGMTLMHMVFASKIMSMMLGAFQLNDYGLILGCIGITCAAFAALYMAVYFLTSRVYYRIVRW